jgi:hypothetical protein
VARADDPGTAVAGPAPIPPSSDSQLARILDLFEEHVYAGEITPSGSYVDHASEVTLGSLLGGDVPAGVERGEFWESRILAEDWAAYEAFNRRSSTGSSPT